MSIQGKSLESVQRVLSTIHRVQIVAAFVVAVGVGAEFVLALGSKPGELWAILTVAIGVFGEAISVLWSQPYEKRIESTREADARDARVRIAEANAEVAAAKERLALTEHRLLAERRLTANERWRLERLERAVLPRTITAEQSAFLVERLSGIECSINVCVVDRAEPRAFAIELSHVFLGAGLDMHLVFLASNVVFMGVSLRAPDDRGSLVSRILWEFRIGGSTSSWLPSEIERIHGRDRNYLIVGENDAAMQPADGQPGEDMDVHGDAVPRP